jgi:hypothetical protein
VANLIGTSPDNIRYWVQAGAIAKKRGGWPFDAAAKAVILGRVHDRYGPLARAAEVANAVYRLIEIDLIEGRTHGLVVAVVTRGDGSTATLAAAHDADDPVAQAHRLAAEEAAARGMADSVVVDLRPDLRRLCDAFAAADQYGGNDDK